MKREETAKTPAVGAVWIVCQQQNGTLVPVTEELLLEGRRLADQKGTELEAVLLGDQVAQLTGRLDECGADRVYLCEHPLLREYTTEGYTKVICQLVQKHRPEVLLLGATALGRDLAPRCAARLHTGLCADCTRLDVDVAAYQEFLREHSTLKEGEIAALEGNRELKMTLPAFGGNLMATICCPDSRPVMATVRPGVLGGMPVPERTSVCQVERVRVELAQEELRTAAVVRETAEQLADLSGAEVIVAVGRGISKDPERGLALAEELAELLGGTVGATRGATDNGWLSLDRMIGHTGQTVRPKLYIALGVSGAIQHQAGMKDSGCIVAINRQANAPIFELADYGICGDLFRVVPALIREIRQEQSAR